MDHLTGGMYPGVGASSTGQVDGLAKGGGEGPDELTGHGALPGLRRESPEPGTVVGHDQAETEPVGLSFGFARPVIVPPWNGATFGVRGVEKRQTNSMRAMGALSPRRGPSFKIRV